jgi:CheY-like chemotaxis protein
MTDAPFPSSARPLRVLIADDNRDAADSLAEILRMDAHEVVVAYDGIAAVTVFAEFRPDVAMLDIGMPQLNGHQVAQRIRSADPERRVTLIAVSGWGQGKDKETSQQAGFDHHLTKPVDFSQVDTLLAQVKAGRSAPEA